MMKRTPSSLQEKGDELTGNDQQTKPQVLTKGDAALLMSCASGNAIRLSFSSPPNN